MHLAELEQSVHLKLPGLPPGEDRVFRSDSSCVSKSPGFMGAHYTGLRNGVARISGLSCFPLNNRGLAFAFQNFPGSISLAGMCGRLTLIKDDLDAVATSLHATVSAETRAQYRPRYNVAPTDRHPLLRPAEGAPVVHLETWGFLRPAVGGKPAGLAINARAETAPFLPLFREGFARHRCVVIADGFYEWRGSKGAREPLWISRQDGDLLLLAGLCDRAMHEPGGRFTILTTAPNRMVAAIHDRMPAVLSRECAFVWLERPEIGLLVPAAEEILQARPVGDRVNSVKNDDPSCLLPPPAEPRGQLRLF
jgi:putative SOS response-associated peptidase YedK